MKILRISLCNLASLGGEHTVDFTRAPLLTSGLFSISGQTGSGKSTLLDALCLALYNNTPRLKTVVGAEKIPDANNGLGQEDPRTLVRRGAPEAYAEVSFVGVDGGTYTARWKVRRARLKPTGTLQAVEMTLHSGNVPRNSEAGLISGGKITEVKQAIIDRVGLTFDQFRRAILLAQGDFATFLKSKDNERAEILEALTGTERFTAISIAIFERYRDQSNALQSIEAKLEGSKPLSPEERAKADDALQTASNAQDSLEKTLETLKAQLRWFADLDQQHAQVNAAKETLEKARATSADSKQRRLELAHIETASMKARPCGIRNPPRKPLPKTPKLASLERKPSTATPALCVTSRSQSSGKPRTLSQMPRPRSNARNRSSRKRAGWMPPSPHCCSTLRRARGNLRQASRRSAK